MKKELLEREKKILLHWHQMIQLKNFWNKERTVMTNAKKKILDLCNVLEEVISLDTKYLIHYEHLKSKCKLYRAYERFLSKFLTLPDYAKDKNICVIPIVIQSEKYGLFINKNDLAFQKTFVKFSNSFEVEKKNNKTITFVVRSLDELIIIKVTNIKLIETVNSLCYMLLTKFKTIDKYSDLKIFNVRHFMTHNENLDNYEINKSLYSIVRKPYSNRLLNYYINTKFDVSLAQTYKERLLKHCINPDKFYYGYENFKHADEMNDFSKRFDKVRKAKYNTHVIKNIARRQYSKTNKRK